MFVTPSIRLKFRKMCHLKNFWHYVMQGKKIHIYIWVELKLNIWNIYIIEKSHIYMKRVTFHKELSMLISGGEFLFQNTETTGQSQSASWQLPSFSSEHSRWYCPALPWRTVGLSEEEMGLWLARGRAGLKPSLLTSETLFNNNTNLSSLEVKLTH